MSAIRTLSIATAILAAIAASTARLAYADDTPDAAFAKRMFASDAKPKNYACFVRRYDAEHMAQHPLQKVTAMRLLITAEKMPDDKVLEYSFRLGVNFRDRPGDFDSSGECGHAPMVVDPSNLDAPTAPSGIDFSCSVDCDGGGMTVNLANKDASVIMKLDRIRIWKGKDPDEAAVSALQAGADDKVFRLDRTSVGECTSLVADRKELAAMRHK
ncbi:MAG TPA: hypothetical protein VG271_17095 [Beijerinckiaceae bacterium]|nr:hypothetical protein [Beijerinckiaceae bacterium]